MAKNVSNLDTLLEAAHTAPVRGLTSEHLPVIEVLRAKGYSWRDVATFLTEHGFPSITQRCSVS